MMIIAEPGCDVVDIAFADFIVLHSQERGNVGIGYVAIDFGVKVPKCYIGVSLEWRYE